MHRFTWLATTLLISSFPLLACGGDSGQPKNPPTSTKAASASEGFVDACTILTADLMQGVFDIGQAELSLRPGMNKAVSSCVASWPVANAQEVKAAGSKAMQAYMMAKASGQDDPGPMPIFKLEHEVRLTFAGQEFEDDAAAQAAFDALMVTLEKGVTAEAEYKGTKGKHTFKVEYDHQVDGVGEKAAWAPKLKQLTFVSGRRIIHLNVDLGDPVENEDMAIETAKRVVSSL